MKILFVLFLAAFPAALSAQTAGGTLEMVEGLSISAVGSSSLSVARESAAKPFSSHVQTPSAVHGGQGHQNPGSKPGNHNPGNNPGNHNPGNHPGHQNPGHTITPPVVHPAHPVTPPYYPGYNNGHNNPYNPGYNSGHNNPYSPGYPGYIPSGPTHQHTTPISSRPLGKTEAIIAAVLIAALVLVLILA